MLSSTLKRERLYPNKRVAKRLLYLFCLTFSIAPRIESKASRGCVKNSAQLCGFTASKILILE